MKATTKKLSFAKNPDLWFDELKSQFQDYLKKNNLKRTGNWKLYLKTIILLSSAVSTYMYLVLWPPGSIFMRIFLCGMLGSLVALIGFNVGHDALHGSFSSRKWVNEIVGQVFGVLGASPWLWKTKHNTVHHTAPNVAGHDNDIEQYPFIRVSSTDKLLPLHKYQFIYAEFFYALTYTLWVFVLDFKKYFQRRVCDQQIYINGWQHVLFWSFKAVHVTIFFVIPSYTYGIWGTLIGYFVFLSPTAGLVLSNVFQLAHIVEESHFTQADKLTGKVAVSNATLQVLETTDFCVNNRILSWFLGGLNYQVVHHLFPKVSHIHYPEIQKMLAVVSKKRGVPYKVNKTLSDALRSHFRYLKKMGREPQKLAA